MFQDAGTLVYDLLESLSETSSDVLGQDTTMIPKNLGPVFVHGVNATDPF